MLRCVAADVSFGPGFFLLYGRREPELHPPVHCGAGQRDDRRVSRETSAPLNNTPGQLHSERFGNGLAPAVEYGEQTVTIGWEPKFPVV